MNTHLMARLSILVALVGVAGAAAWHFEGYRFDASSHQSATGSTTLVTTTAVTSAALVDKVNALDHPVYWIGASSKPTTYELTEESNGETFVRYLPVGATAGSRVAYLAIGTYPMQNAFAVTKAIVAKKNGVVQVAAPKSGVAFYYRSRPENVFMAFPNTNYQVELFDPSSSLASRIVESGAVTDVSAIASNAEHQVTQDQLLAYSKSLGQPIYWLGPKPGMTYAFTRTANGSIFVRYLPVGVAPGVDRPYLTVATYPMANAFGVMNKLGKTTASIRMAGSKVYMSLRHKSNSTYVGFRGVNFQVEIYNPDASAAQQVAASGLVSQVG